jgi:tetratricopeptide (TPR) repeat protein
MKKPILISAHAVVARLVCAGLCAVLPACCQKNTPPVVSVEKPSPLAIVLASHMGTDRTDRDISRLQQQIRDGRHVESALEQLGWAFVAKARTTFDPGFYNLAEQCALVIESTTPNKPEALLLRGHALQSLHRFKEAESLARELVAQRGRAFDYGLLGDVLMEQGRLDEAITAYQQMADIKPDLHAYTRAAHVRWLKGDLEGALEMMQLAVSAASPRDGESAAWVYSRAALYELQAGNFEQSLRCSAAALEFQSNYPPALLVRGKVFLARGDHADAVAALTIAAAANPLPEYQWTLAEALRAANRAVEAASVERAIKQSGAITDPRTFALYLATFGEDSIASVKMAEAELETRADVFTHDALAWALASAGRWTEASTHARRALAEGTRDARLFLHAGIISAELHQTEDAKRYLSDAAQLQHMLLPSEQQRLLDCGTRLGLKWSAPPPDKDSL